MNAYRTEAALAEALDRALGRPPGGGVSVLDPQLAELVEVSHALEYAASEAVPSAEFRNAARQRLVTEMSRSSQRATSLRSSLADSIRMWSLRIGAGLAALSFAGAAAASASASALPGDALYPVKQATEGVALQLAPTESARQDVLLRQADTRVDEAARLLDLGRAADAAATVARYDDTVALLAEATGSEKTEAGMRTNEVRLQQLLNAAPLPARPGLERALAATERHLGRPRSSPAANNVEVGTSVAQPTNAPTPEAGQPARPFDATDGNSRELQSSRAADAAERAVHESHAGPAADHGQDAERSVDVPPARRVTEPENPEVSQGHSETVPKSDNRPIRADDSQSVIRTPGSGAPPAGNSVRGAQAGGRGRP